MRLLTAQETAERLGVRIMRVYELIKSGVLPGVRLGKRQIRVDDAALERFVRSGGARDPAAVGALPLWADQRTVIPPSGPPPAA